MAERAARIAAMLARWGTDDLSEEPDLNVEDIEPVMLRPSNATEPRRP